MKSFDDSWRENRHVFESTKNLAKAMYLDGQQSRQSEVDELRKRIDDALNYVFGLYTTGDLDTEKLENILKGENHES